MPLSPPGRPLFLARFLSYRFLGLLLAVMTLLVASPLMGNDVLHPAAVAVLLSILLFTTVIAASTARHVRWIAATLAMASGLTLFAGLALEHRVIYLPVVALFTTYLAYTIGVVLHRMVITTQIDADILCGAAAIYFLLASSGL
jgi:hypothetical protein